MQRPIYNVATEGRIANAIARARTTNHRAHYLGTSPQTGARVYQVWSNTHPGAVYVVHALEHPRVGGYVYTRAPGSPGSPAVWLSCSCDSWSTYQQPCWHCARVALRIDREYRRAQSRAPRARTIATTTNHDNQPTETSPAPSAPNLEPATIAGLATIAGALLAGQSIANLEHEHEPATASNQPTNQPITTTGGNEQ